MEAAYLVIANGVAKGSEGELHRWYQQEHLKERLSVPGFLSARRYEAVGGEPRYIAVYETAGLDIESSPAYRERLSNPTDWTQRVMPLFVGMSRTFMRPILSHQMGAGGTASFLFFDWPLAEPSESDIAERFLDIIHRLPHRSSSVESFALMRGAQAGSGKSEEAMLRPGRDHQAAWLAMVEWSEPSAHLSLMRAFMQRGLTVQSRRSGLYRLLCLRRAPENRRSS